MLPVAVTRSSTTAPGLSFLPLKSFVSLAAPFFRFTDLRANGQPLPLQRTWSFAPAGAPLTESFVSFVHRVNTLQPEANVAATVARFASAPLQSSSIPLAGTSGAPGRRAGLASSQS